MEIQFDSEYTDLEFDWTQPESYIFGMYLDENGVNIRDFNVDEIHTGNWKKFKWVEFINYNNLYERIDSYMFNINQYSLDNRFNVDRYNAIVDSINKLYSLAYQYYINNPYYFFVYICRYFQLLRWIFQTPHLDFLRKYNPEYVIEIYKNIEELYKEAICLVDIIESESEIVLNPYEDDDRGIIMYTVECMDVIYNFIEFFENIKKIQKWIKNKNEKKNIIKRVVSLNTLNKRDINFDCIEKILYYIV